MWIPSSGWKNWILFAIAVALFALLRGPHSSGLEQVASGGV